MVILQWPNEYLITMLSAWFISLFTTGLLHALSRAVFYGAGFIWAYEEIIHGVNWFRRLLGIGVALILIYGLARSLL